MKAATCPGAHLVWHPRRAITQTRFVGRDAMNLPSKLVEPHHIFVMPAGDLFTEPDNFIMNVFEVMAANEQHDFQIATRAVDRVLALNPHLPWRDNIWVGALFDGSADELTLAKLRRTDAKVRFAHLRARTAPMFDPKGLDLVIVEGPHGSKDPRLDRLQAACDTAHVKLFAGRNVETAVQRTSSALAVAPTTATQRRRG